jgi:hypothetical protein
LRTFRRRHRLVVVVDVVVSASSTLAAAAVEKNDVALRDAQGATVGGVHKVVAVRLAARYGPLVRTTCLAAARVEARKDRHMVGGVEEED